MIINIYGLVYPSTQEVIYVGQTRTSIKIGAYKENNLIKSFEYGFEINEFIGSKSAYSNVHKVLTGKLIYKPYGHNWKYIE